MTSLAVRAAWAAAVLAAGCSRAPRSVSTEARDAPPRAEVPMASSPPAAAAPVTATVVAVDLRRPPLVELQLDLITTNPTGAPRWLLVPRDLANPVGERGVDVLEVMRWTGAAGSADLGSFLGTGGFFAAQLAPGASLHVRGLPVQWFQDDLDQPAPPLPVFVADTVDVGGKPADAWFPSPPLISGAVDVARREIAGSVRFRPDSSELPVVLGGVERIELTLTLPAP